MGISSTIKERNIEINFEKVQLLSSSNLIILTTGVFDAKGFSGVVVWVEPACNDFEIGDFRTTWLPPHFEKFTGEITIKSN